MDISIRELARRAKVNPGAAHAAATAGRYPVRDAAAAERLRKALDAAKAESGDDGSDIAQKRPQQEFNAVKTHARRSGLSQSSDPRRGNAGELVSEASPFEGITQEEVMLIQKPRLSPETIAAFGVSPAAFTPPAAREEVFLSGSMRVAYEHLLAKARFGGMIALVGESGAGKSTLKDLLTTDLAAEGDVVVIEPHTQRMEETDKAGKTLKGGDIVEAIMGEIAPGTRLKRTAEAQLKQVAACLAESQSASRNRRHLLVIEEAHCLPKPTLRHLKRFLEMKNPAVKGLQRPMLSIVLIGQPELADRLSPYDQSVREIWQRCEVARLAPLGKALPDYARFRLGKASEHWEAEAFVALAEILTARDGRSFAYPLAVDNWLAIILNASAGLGKAVTAAHVKEAHTETVRRLRGGR